MGTIIATIITGLVGLCLGVWMVRGMRLEKAKKEHFRSRDPAPIRPWLEPLVDHSDYQLAEEQLIRLAQAIGLDPMKLRPDDLFCDGAHSIASYCGGDEEFDEAFGDECDRYGRDENKGQRIKTVADYIRFFASQDNDRNHGHAEP